MVCCSQRATDGFTDRNGVYCLEGDGGGVDAGHNANDTYAPGGQGVIYHPGQQSVVI
ncbi:hypothetical protein BAUCODRAFT_37435 [Baudoinia panamericana UAMH 10762]|uniref:Uncharacterized protein n=1 Tax=Baudoinia panamericana (strain UAMH 10762) TaxID=717646 RepID=M2N4Q0_BAUPA|nr:uncharacterized protein BAUCODRAFT_37435 [Baudoinia panamericana UAMH 10762]EMC93715.1 hypothetical protein BAUCODRAFT_37435 [Baudoinia panamericana UAMH 10762]